MMATPDVGLESLPSVREDAEEEEWEGDDCDGGNGAIGDKGGTQVKSDDVSWRNSDVIPKIMVSNRLKHSNSHSHLNKWQKLVVLV